MVPRLVVIVAFADVQVLDVAGPHEVFAGANAWNEALGTGGSLYDVRVVAEHAGPVASESGLSLVAGAWGDLGAAHPIDTLIVPGGPATRTMAEESPVVHWVRTVAPSARRVVSVCTGAFVVARAGLLAGRRVTTHWRYADRLAREHPDVTVDPDPIYIADGAVWTSAGVTAGIDLSLALVEADHGPDVAGEIARSLVMFVRRPGGQSQFAVPTWTERARRPPVREAQHLVDSAPGDDHRVPVLAARVGMSERHFTRLFADQVGVPPARYVERVRVEAARRLLEAESATTDVIARRCGFGTAETLRRAFHRQLGVAPDAYRARFGRTAAGSTHRQEG